MFKVDVCLYLFKLRTNKNKFNFLRNEHDQVFPFGYVFVNKLNAKQTNMKKTSSSPFQLRPYL